MCLCIVIPEVALEGVAGQPMKFDLVDFETSRRKHMPVSYARRSCIVCLMVQVPDILTAVGGDRPGNGVEGKAIFTVRFWIEGWKG
jgi:hypothetical protein